MMDKKELRERLLCIKMYFSGCKWNASPGSQGEKTFAEYEEAIEHCLNEEIEKEQIIKVIAEYLTDNLIIPPNGTVPATKEERMQEWVKELEALRT